MHIFQCIDFLLATLKFYLMLFIPSYLFWSSHTSKVVWRRAAEVVCVLLKEKASLKVLIKLWIINFLNQWNNLKYKTCSLIINATIVICLSRSAIIVLELSAGISSMSFACHHSLLRYLILTIKIIFFLNLKWKHELVRSCLEWKLGNFKNSSLNFTCYCLWESRCIKVA